MSDSISNVITVRNFAPQPRTNIWCTLGSPAIPELEPGQAMRYAGDAGRYAYMVYGKRLSHDHARAHVLFDYLDPESLSSFFIDDKIQFTPWYPSDWLMNSNIVELKVQVITPKGDVHDQHLLLGKLEVLEDCAAVKIFRSTGRIEGTPLVFDLNLYAYSGQDYVPFELQIVNSDPSTTKMNFPIESVSLITGERPVIYSVPRRGGAPPQFRNEIYDTLLCERLTFGNGQALNWYGSLLIDPTGTPGGMTKPTVALLGEAQTHTDKSRSISEFSARTQNLEAEEHSPVVAFDLRWLNEGAWGPLGVTPEHPENLKQEEVTKGLTDEVLIFNHERENRFDGPFAVLSETCYPQPGSTGDQPGFGYTKLSKVLATGDPAFLIPARYSALHSWGLRPFHFRGRDAQPIRHAEHKDPRLVFWSEEPHYHWDVCQDRLGKTDKDDQRPDHHGWEGHDNQHLSPLHEIGYAILSGSAMSYRHMDQACEAFLCGQNLPSDYGWIPTTGPDAPRAIGRTMLTGAWLYKATGRHDILERMMARVEEVYVTTWAGRKLDGKKIRILGVEGPDGRGPNPEEKFWRPPFEAMGVVGLYMAGMAAPEGSNARQQALEIAYHVATTLAFHGVYPIYGTYRAMWGVTYLDGDKEGNPLPVSDYTNPSKVQWGDGDWEAWSYGGIAVGQYLAKHFDDHALALQCDQVAKDFRTLIAHSDDWARVWRVVEWMAV